MNKIILIAIILIIGLLGGVVYVKTSQPKEEKKNIARTIKIIAFGDSLTAGYGVGEADNYPSQLQALLMGDGYDVEILNRGISGETTAQGKERAQRIRDEGADIILLGLGGNDALQRRSLDETRTNLSTIIETLQSGDTPPQVLLLTMKVPLVAGLTFGFSYKDDFENLYGELAEKYQIIAVPFLVSEVLLSEKYGLPDKIHLNKEGYAFLVSKYVAPAVKKAIGNIAE